MGNSDLSIGLLIVNPTDWGTLDAFRLFIRAHTSNGLHLDTFPESAIFIKADAGIHADFYRLENTKLSRTTFFTKTSFQAQNTTESKPSRQEDNSCLGTLILLRPCSIYNKYKRCF